MEYDPSQDGITHINTYSRGRTKLGRMLSNFYYAPFEHPEHGHFDSVEGYWYWLKHEDNALRSLSGYQAKKYGKDLSRQFEEIQRPDFEDQVITAIQCKLLSNTDILEEMIKNDLPYAHYYVYESKYAEPKVIPVECTFFLKTLEDMRDFYRSTKG